MEAEYKYGFTTPLEMEQFPCGLSEEVVRAIWKKKEEPEFVLEFRLRAFDAWKKMKRPLWAAIDFPPIDFQAMSYYCAPKKKQSLASLSEVDPELIRTFEKLGIPLEEQKRLTNVAVDLVFDSVSLGTTFNKKLEEAGVVLCSLSEAMHRYPDLVRRYLGSVVPVKDNFYAALNAAVFSDGSFVYVPKGVECPVELSTYFRINSQNTGQFERTLIIADDHSSVRYLEGCTAPSFKEGKQLHAAVVELIALEGASIHYATVQNWYPGDRESGEGGVYNFVTKRGLCEGAHSQIAWTQVEVGSAITWKYPSCILKGKGSVGSFHSVALTTGHMQADTGSKMIHIGENSSSTIVSKGISADCSRNSYRGIVQINPSAKGARNYTQCDSMLVGSQAVASTYPTIRVRQKCSQVEHEASTSQLSEEQLFYFMARGIDKEAAMQFIVNGFCENVLEKIPLEFAVEARKLLSLKLESSVG